MIDNIKRGESVQTSHSNPDSWVRLIRLADAQLELTNPLEDVRGHRVFGLNQREIGYVRALMVDEATPKVHFIEIAFGGVLGLWESAYLVPVELVTQVGKDKVFVAQTREQISRVPRYEPELRDLAPDDAMLIQEYYGSPFHGQY